MDSKLQTAAALATPAITQVLDGAGALPNPGTTHYTDLTLSGSADASAVVILFANGAALGSASVTVNGTWQISVTVTLGTHEFTVSERAGPVSSPWIITVAVIPVITSVMDSAYNSVPQGGVTTDTRLIISGMA